MIQVGANSFVISNVEELPQYDNPQVVFVDLETTSKDRSKKSTTPHRDCWVAGIAVTVDDDPKAYYIPVLHRYDYPAQAIHPSNLPVAPVREWLVDLLTKSQAWVNQGILYDLAVLRHDRSFAYNHTGVVVDTLTTAKLIDTDRLGRYRLEHLAEDWLGKDIMQYKDGIGVYLNNRPASESYNQDYGCVPIDVMGTYACEDVLTTRELSEYINEHMPPEVAARVYGMEVEVTSELAAIEAEGLQLNVPAMQLERVKTAYTCIGLRSALEIQTGIAEFSATSAQMRDYIVNVCGLPVLAWNEDKKKGTKTPHFGKRALALYKMHPLAKTETVQDIINFRKQHKLLTGFFNPYVEHMVVDRLYTSYNQSVETGRMASSRPNIQQLNKAIKALIIPGEGNSFLSIDASQIEFRIIAHYIHQQQILEAFIADPDADYHAWVARLADIQRTPAKTANFLMGYGGGKDKLISTLSTIEDFVADIKEEADRRTAAGESAEEVMRFFHLEANARGADIYNRYHEAMPTLKPVSNKMRNVCRERGYVRNLYNRRRHLSPEFSRKALNSVCQSSAADILKEAVVRLGTYCRHWGGPKTVALVHDEALIQGKTEVVTDPEFIRGAIEIIETPNPVRPLKVPIRCAYGYSSVSWADCDKPGPVPWPLADSTWMPDVLARCELAVRAGL